MAAKVIFFLGRNRKQIMCNIYKRSMHYGIEDKNFRSCKWFGVAIVAMHTLFFTVYVAQREWKIGILWLLLVSSTPKRCRGSKNNSADLLLYGSWTEDVISQMQWVSTIASGRQMSGQSYAVLVLHIALVVAPTLACQSYTLKNLSMDE